MLCGFSHSSLTVMFEVYFPLKSRTVFDERLEKDREQHVDSTVKGDVSTVVYQALQQEKFRYEVENKRFSRKRSDMEGWGLYYRSE